MKSGKNYTSTYPDFDNREFDFFANANFISKFTYCKFGIGAEAVKTLLESVDLDKEVEIIKAQLKESGS